jgi:hypothetical protein
MELSDRIAANESFVCFDLAALAADLFRFLGGAWHEG